MGGCQPQAVDTAGLTTLFLPHPTSLPKVNAGAEGIQQTHNLCGDFFAKIPFPAFKSLSLPRFLRPGVQTIREVGSIQKKSHTLK